MGRKAFTLFELMIVVVIIGLVYGLVITNFSTKKALKLSHLENIKDALMPLWSKGKRVEILLYDKCSKGVVFINDKLKDEYKPTIILSDFKKITAYRDDISGTPKEIEWKSFLLNKKVEKSCFDFTIFPNGSSTSYILKRDEQYYVFPPYFGDVNITDNMDEAMSIFKNSDITKVTLEDAK